MSQANSSNNFSQWVKNVERPALRQAAKAKRQAAWKASKTRRVLIAILKEAGLLGVMCTITLGVVYCETGDLGQALHVAGIAGPIKATAAAMYGKLVG
jgi:hypothetical protein